MQSKRERFFQAAEEMHSLRCPVCGQALERQGDNVFLRQETTLKDLNEDGEKRFSISRRYFAAPDPLTSVHSLRDIQVD